MQTKKTGICAAGTEYTTMTRGYATEMCICRSTIALLVTYPVVPAINNTFGLVLISLSWLANNLCRFEGQKLDVLLKLTLFCWRQFIMNVCHLRSLCIFAIVFVAACWDSQTVFDKLDSHTIDTVGRGNWVFLGFSNYTNTLWWFADEILRKR